MKLLQSLSAPWLLRRLVRSSERQAIALEEIRDAIWIIAKIPRTPSQEIDQDADDDYSVSTDQSSYEAEERQRRRARFVKDE